VTLFLEVLRLERVLGMSKLGTVALDGTKLHANASGPSALSYSHAKKIEKQLKREVKQRKRVAVAASGRARAVLSAPTFDLGQHFIDCNAVGDRRAQGRIQAL